MVGARRQDIALERWRGQVDERIDRLIEVCEQQRRDFKEERDAARQHREGLRDVIGALSMSVGNLAENVKRMEPTVADYRDNAAEARGAAKLGRVLWAGLVALGTALGAALTALFQRPS